MHFKCECQILLIPAYGQKQSCGYGVLLMRITKSEGVNLSNVKKSLFSKALYIKPFCPESLLFRAKSAYVALQRDL
jgi:hypothetical protein